MNGGSTAFLPLARDAGLRPVARIERGAGSPLGRALARAGPSVAPRRLSPGEVVVREGAPSGNLFLVESGAVALLRTAASGRRGMVGILGSGQVFGLGWIHVAPPAASAARPGVELGGRTAPAESDVATDASEPEARALAPSLVSAFDPEALRAAAASDPRLALHLVTALAHRLQEAERTLFRMLLLPVAARLEGTLRTLAAVHGRPVAEGRRVDLRLTQEDLAALAGTSRESVNRALRDLAARDRVLRIGGRYVVRDVS